MQTNLSLQIFFLLCDHTTRIYSSSNSIFKQIYLIQIKYIYLDGNNGSFYKRVHFRYTLRDLYIIVISRIREFGHRIRSTLVDLNIVTPACILFSLFCSFPLFVFHMSHCTSYGSFDWISANPKSNETSADIQVWIYVSKHKQFGQKIDICRFAR